MEMSSYLAPHTPDGALEETWLEENGTLWAKPGSKSSFLPIGENLQVHSLLEQQLWGEAESQLVAQTELLPTWPWMSPTAAQGHGRSTENTKICNVLAADIQGLQDQHKSDVPL